MKSWTIRQRIITGFAALLLLFSAVAVTSLVLLRQVKANQRDIVEVALPGISFAAHIKANASEIQLAVLRHLIARTPEQKQISEDIIETLRVEIAKNIERYEKTMTAEEDRQRFNQMDAARTAYIKARAPVLELSRANKMDEAEALNLTSLRPAYLAYAKACDELYAYNEAHGNQAGAESQKLLNQTNSVITIATSLAIVLGIAFATVITVGLSRVLQRLASSLDEGANQVVAAAGQVSAASQSLAEGASEQAASLEETSASLEEMASMTKGNAESAAKAKALSNQTRAAADAGATDMGEMKQAMGAIKASSDDISKIIKTIDEIAFQTNILALNAAVEAARAGEAGAGFAVVAEEVRNLAQRSAQSARETAEKIEDSIRKSEHGVHISNKVAQSLGEIVEKAREVDVLVAEIATASQEQSKGIEQVNLAVSQMDTVTQANASGAEESASAAEELSAQAASQKEAVEDLLKLVGSTGRGKRRSAPPSIWKSKPSDKPAKSPTRTQPVRLDHSEANERGQPKLSFAAASTPHVNGHHNGESDHFES